jgi:hypothetical protein
MQLFAEAIFGSRLGYELIHIPHYGMPTASSVAIGCSWSAYKSILLSLPGKDFYLIENPDASKWLTPHGFGASVTDADISYRQNGLFISGKQIITDKNVQALPEKNIRLTGAEQRKIDSHVRHILSTCNARIAQRFHPLISVNQKGFQIWDTDELHLKGK